MDCLGVQGVFPRQWAGLNIQDWWYAMVRGPSPHGRGWRRSLRSFFVVTVCGCY
jgi:hypothetical protein